MLQSTSEQLTQCLNVYQMVELVSLVQSRDPKPSGGAGLAGSGMAERV